MKFLFILLFLLCIIIGVLLFATFRTQMSSNQKIFLGGKVPLQSPDGLYRGSAVHTFSWLGKRFDAKNSGGINIFRNSDGTEGERYPFKTYIASGIRDTNLQVIKIDYNLPENPFWLRMVLDEIVETAPGKYVGKLHLRITSGTSFALGYFFLEK